MYDLLKKEQIYSLHIYYKSWLVICRQKMVRSAPRNNRIKCLINIMYYN